MDFLISDSKGTEQQKREKHLEDNQSKQNTITKEPKNQRTKVPENYRFDISASDWPEYEDSES